MSRVRVLSIGVFLGLLFAIGSWVAPSPARAAWVNSTGTQFQVGGQLTETVPTAAGTTFTDPTCGSQGGTSLALVPGTKVAGVDSVLHPVVLVVSCLDNGGSATVRSRLNFVSPADGTVLSQVSTTAVPSNGWAHLVHRPDKGDLLGCGDNGALYRIDYSSSTPTVDGTATFLPVPQAVTSCKGLTWDAEQDMIYVGLSVSGGAKIGRVVRFKDNTTTLLGDFTNLPCVANGLAVTGGVLLLSCEGSLAIHRLDKNTGVTLGVHGSLNATGVAALNNEPGLGDLACDPVTFHKDVNGKDLFTDAVWSRRGANGNGVVALEFPAFTCGLPASSVTLQNLVPLSPLAAGLSAAGPAGPGQFPLAACFDGAGNVKDGDNDGLPDCWEGTGAGVDFNGDGAIDLSLCVGVDTNGDGVVDATECAQSNHKDLFVEIDYMEHHKPDPKALSQTQGVAIVGVKSVREAFAAAPVANPDATGGIRIHFQVDEQVTFTPVAGAPTSHVNQVAFTPCTGPASSGLDPAQSADFDVIKAANFGTAADRANAHALNAKRLAFRYVLFAHNPVGNPSGGSSGSGCAEVGGDDAVVTLGSFATTTVDGISHGRGNTDQQAGTFMHEFGHLLGLRHGGHDGVNCKPNYRSVMSYTRQFAGSPIINRRLDYSRSLDPLVLLPNLSVDPNKTGFLNEASLNEFDALGVDPSLGPLPPYFPSADQVAFGPGAWSLVTATALDINWNRSKQGPNPTFQTSAIGDLNAGATTGCDGVGAVLEGHDDWSNILYRPSAAIDFAGGFRTDTPREMDKDDERAFFLARDADANGAADGTDCGGVVLSGGTTSFPCTHRIDMKPSAGPPKIITLGTEATATVAIFSEVNGSQVWNASAQVKKDTSLTLSIESVVVPVKINSKGQGTCSTSDVPDPVTSVKDGIKDLKCQFPTSGLPVGTHFAIVSGFFFDPLTGEDRAFSARQEVTILP
jgi:hypothetical protein